MEEIIGKDSLTAEGINHDILSSRAFFVYGLRLKNKNGLIRKTTLSLDLSKDYGCRIYVLNSVNRREKENRI